MLIWEALMSNQGQCISQSGKKEPVVEMAKVNTQERNSKYTDLLYFWEIFHSLQEINKVKITELFYNTSSVCPRNNGYWQYTV